MTLLHDGEVERVENHRLRRFIEMGFDAEEAVELAASDVDLHDAGRLVEKVVAKHQDLYLAYEILV